MTRRNRRKNLPNEGHETRLSTGREMLQRLSIKLWHPVNNASLVFFRFAFGTIMVWEVLRNATATGSRENRCADGSWPER